MHQQQAIAAILLTTLVAACGSGASSPGATTGPARTASASPAIAPTDEPSASILPTVAPTVALGPAVTLELDETGPMIRSTDGPAGHPYALPAAASRDASGGYVLFIVWFGPEPGDQVVTLARSDDGRTWGVGKETLFTDLGMELANPGPIPSSALQLPDGTWLLYGWAAHRTDSRVFTSWRASATQPEGPWTLDVETVLPVGAPTAWDSQTTSIAGVHRTADGYALWYEGQAPGSTIRGDVGYATSADGLAWQKAPDPVIRRGICGPGTSPAIFQPEVRAARGGGLLAILGAFAPGRETMDLFGATSVDGIDWRCGSMSPLLRPTDLPGSEGIHTIASMELEDGTTELIVESLGPSRSDLWSAIVDVAR